MSTTKETPKTLTLFKSRTFWDFISEMCPIPETYVSPQKSNNLSFLNVKHNVKLYSLPSYFPTLAVTELIDHSQIIVTP